MKRWFYIGIVLMVVLAGCGYSPDSPALTGTPSQRGTASRTLENIDSLMWRQPDSAFAVMMEFAASPEADSLDVFEGHYCQVLVAELLYKNYKRQSNRDDVLKAVGYFDSIVAADGYKADGRKADTRGASLRERNVFLDARAHYINGAGFYEQGDVVNACTEYLKALEAMEEQYEEKELTGKKAVFMFYAYNRLLELFSAQFMMEPALSCGEKALSYCQNELSLSKEIPNAYYHIGKQYDKMGEKDIARRYYGQAIEGLSDINNLVYRDVVSTKALCDYQVGLEADASITTIKKMLDYANSEKETLTRLLTIGGIFTVERSFDSAIYYLEPVFENKDDVSLQIRAAEYLLVDYNHLGDKAKSDECMRFLANHKKTDGETKALVSKLEAMFKNYQNKKQERLAEIEREKAIKKAMRIIIPIIVVVLVVYFVLILRNKKQLKKQQEEADRMLGETEQEHEKERKQWQLEAQKALEEKDRHHIEAIKKQQDEAIQQARTLLPQRVNDLYRSKVSNRMERIMAEFEAAYPLAMERLAAAYPDLNEAERQIAVLNFLRFRAKEEADLTGFTENTTLKYRSNLNKKAGSDPISALIAEGKI